MLLLLILLRAILAYRRHRKALLTEDEEEIPEHTEEVPTEETVKEGGEVTVLNQDVVFSQEEEILIGVKTEEAPKVEETAPVMPEPVKEPIAEAKPVINTVIEKKPEAAAEIAPVLPKETPKKETKKEMSDLADLWIRSIVSEKAEPAVHTESVAAAKPEIKTEPVIAPKEEKKVRAFSEMDAYDILAQFKMELEEARLRTLSEEKEASYKD